MVKWDLVDEPGGPSVALDVEALRDVPSEILQDILKAIGLHKNPGGKQKG